MAAKTVELKQSTIRIPQVLHREINKIAAVDRRTFNAQVEVLLDEAVAARKAAKPKAA